MEIEYLLLLFMVAVGAGVVDAIAGGGGLITVPVLIFTGMNPLLALGTNKLQASFGALSATLSFAKNGHINWQKATPMGFIALFCGVIGAFFASYIHKEYLSVFIPIVLICVSIYFLLKKTPKPKLANKKNKFIFFLIALPMIAFYDGIFGPGAGSFYMVACVSILGLNMIESTAYTKFVNTASNIGGLVFFIISGLVMWKVGLVMAVGAFIGAKAGAKIAMHVGPKIIRPLLVIISTSLAIKLLADPNNLLHQYIVSL